MRWLILVAASLLGIAPAHAQNSASPGSHFGSPAASALAARGYQQNQQFLNRNLCVYGDSISAIQTSQLASVPADSIIANQNSNRGYNVWAAFLSRGRVLVNPASALNFGVSGDTTASMGVRLQPVIRAPCSTVIVLGGVNDVDGNGVPSATVLNNLTNLDRALTAAGKTVIGSTVWPFSSSTASIRDSLWLLNKKIRDIALPGVVIVDPAQAYGDPTSATNAPRTNYAQGDGLHPSSLGGYATGSIYAQALTMLYPDRGDPVSSRTDIWTTTNTTGNLLPVQTTAAPSPFSTASNAGTCNSTTCPSGGASGTIATGWDLVTVAGSGGNVGTLGAAGSLVTTADGRVWQQITLSGTVTTGGSGLCTGSVPCVSDMGFVQFGVLGPLIDVSAGDQIYASCVVQVDPGVANVSGVALDIFWYDGTNSTWTGDMDGIAGDVYPNPPATMEGIVRTPVFKVPATNTFTKLLFTIQLPNGSSFSPTGTFRVGNCALRKMQ